MATVAKMTPPPFFDLVLNGEDLAKDALRLIDNIRPGWKREEIKCKVRGAVYIWVVRMSHWVMIKSYSSHTNGVAVKYAKVQKHAMPSLHTGTGPIVIWITLVDSSKRTSNAERLFSLLVVWKSCWTDCRVAGDLRRIWEICYKHLTPLFAYIVLIKHDILIPYFLFVLFSCLK